MEIEKQSILLVDDIPENIKILGKALKDIYDIRFATSGLKAIEIASSLDPPDLILLDIVMPDMNGHEVCRRLKKNERTRNIPIIFLTAKDQVEDETLGLEIGAVDYITKPFSLPIVKARVRSHMELKLHQDTLQDLSTRDGLTSIPNRRRFDESYQIEWKRSCRNKLHLSIILIDIDHFKNYNDTYGHTRGDQCLKQVAETLYSGVRRPADLVARYGGEEFICILPETDSNGAKNVAGLLRNVIESLKIPHKESDTAEHVTISLGASTVIPNGSISQKSLIESADRCLYQAKNNGRNQFQHENLV